MHRYKKIIVMLIIVITFLLIPFSGCQPKTDIENSIEEPEREGYLSNLNSSHEFIIKLSQINEKTESTDLEKIFGIEPEYQGIGLITPTYYIADHVAFIIRTKEFPNPFYVENSGVAIFGSWEKSHLFLSLEENHILGIDFQYPEIINAVEKENSKLRSTTPHLPIFLYLFQMRT